MHGFEERLYQSDSLTYPSQMDMDYQSTLSKFSSNKWIPPGLIHK